jgi:glucose dehydrogenase
MRRSRLTVAVVLFLVGLAWIGQGTGLIKGSGMTGSSFWGVAGVAMLVLAGAILISEGRRPASGNRPG